MDLSEGQIIKVYKDEEVPADLLLLMTSLKENGLMHVDTINLDGENNLKEKYSLYKEVNVSELEGCV